MLLPVLHMALTLILAILITFYAVYPLLYKGSSNTLSSRETIRQALSSSEVLCMLLSVPHMALTLILAMLITFPCCTKRREAKMTSLRF